MNLLKISSEFEKKLARFNDEQKKACLVEGISTLVSAGAGSGKTTVLSNRVIALLKCGYDISRILILTFTDNAAQNMKIRIRKGIREEDDIKDAEKYVSGADIMTFDAFNHKLAVKYGSYLGLESGYQIIDENILSVKKIEFLRAYFEKEIQNNNPLIIKILKDYTKKDYDNIINALISAYNKIDIEVDPDEYLQNKIKNPLYGNLDEVYEKLFNEAKNALDNYILETSALLNGKFEKEMIKLQEMQDAYRDVQDFDSLKVKASVFKAIRANRKFDDYTKEEFKRIKEKWWEEFLNYSNFLTREEFEKYQEDKKELYLLFYNLILKMREHIFEYKENRKMYTFQDISHKILKLLRTNKEICDELKYHYQEIMVDEYQDNSDIQEEMINLLENDNLFLVGDVKQSIYLFRNANPSLFTKRYKEYKNGTKKGLVIDMNKNYRSSPAVIEDVNFIFEKIMSEKFGGIDYDVSQKMEASNPKYQNKPYVDELISLKEENGKNLLEVEFNAIALDIKEKIETGNYDYKDFAIILDRTTIFDDAINYLTENGIPVSPNYNGSIMNSNISFLLLDLIKLIDCFEKRDFQSTTFRHIFVALSRSFIVGMNDEEIYNALEEKRLYEVPWIKNLFVEYQKVEGRTSYEIFDTVIKNLQVLERLFFDVNFKDDLNIFENYKKYIKSLSVLNYTPAEMIEYFNLLNENDLKPKGKFGTEKINAVTLINIHLSKGLEYKHCYFPCLYKEYTEREFTQKILFSSKFGFIFKILENELPINVKYSDKNYYNPIRYFYKKEKINEGRQEKIRLLYVALTRAQESFTIVKLDKLNQKDRQIELEDAKCFVDVLKRTGIFTKLLGNHIKLASKEKKEEIIEDIDYGFNYHDLQIKENKIEYNKASSSMIHSDYKTLLFGTKMHETLECMDFKNPDYSNIKDKRILETIKKFVESDLMKEVNKAEVYQEFAFADKKNNTSGIIDLLLVYEDKIQIIDYKLKSMDDPHYVEQLKVYQNYVSQLSSLPIETYLYSLIEGNYKKL